ncbi:granzyme B(G,H)-like [Electrophorus electricus]|uniref:granzyme B(G,H)-like n=1 Tax=Electrophorus electricus TaxID=8005 RepID=UPI0015D01839|nr:granzyme B(G,H)-like [Electrophorus electricus]
MTLTSLFLLPALLPYLALSARMNIGIVNGTEAKPHSRPYMVSLQKDGEHICGGFLVSENYVMTAAHCMHTHTQNLTVVVGAHNLKDRVHIRIPVKSYHRHPDYEAKICLLNDIMLLQLETSAKKAPNVDMISFPEEPNQGIKDNSVCSTAGWGRQTTDGTASDHLMETNVTVMKNICEAHWKQCYNYTAMLCAGGRSHGICKGDSGGPLVCNSTAVGIVSFYQKNNCDHPTAPNVYTKISAFLPWVRKIIHHVQ